MLNIGGGEVLIIFLVALIVLGPTKLPDAAKQAGKIIGEFRRISSGFQREIQSAMNDPVSKVTGEATPRSLKDVTSDAEVPPMAIPADGLNNGQDATPEEAETAPRPADPFGSSSTTFSSVAPEPEAEAAPLDALDDGSVPDEPPEPPVMYGDR